MKNNVAKTILKTAIAIVVLIVLIVAAGVGYVWYTGKNSEQTAKPVLKVPIVSYGLPKPKAPNPKNPESAAIETILSPVAAGANSSVTVKTQPTSKCTIEVSYNNLPSKDSGLVPKTADDYGNITWSWTVDKTAPAGKWPVKVTCAWLGKSAFVQSDLEVTK
jgi:hypothetical protein